ncbi:MAG: YceI family protein [Acetobacteraceae bacterium]
MRHWKIALILSLPILLVDVGQAQPAFNPDVSAVRAGTYELDPAHGKITWTASHFGMSHYKGQFVGLAGRLTLDPSEPERASLQITVPMEKVGTFDTELDRRLRTDFFDVASHPTARFAATRVERVGERQARITGDLTLRGVTRPVTILGTFNAAGIHPVNKRYTIGFDGEATIKRSEFGITTLVPAIGDDVRLDIEAEFRLVD